MKKLLPIWILLMAGYFSLTAQVIDTSRQINTWKLMHNFTRFEEVPLDTNLHQIHRDYQPAFKEGFAYESLGVLGQGLNHVDFFRRPDPDQFIFGTAWYPYLLTPDRTIFFNTKKPFTSLAYSTLLFLNQAPEENVEALHTQNLSPFTNFGINFNILSSKPFYSNQQARVNRVGLFASHAKNKYSIFGSFYYNNFQIDDNGGLLDLDSWLDGESDEVALYPMRLAEAQSMYRNFNFFATQKYNLWEKAIHTDSLGNRTTSGKTLSLSHQLRYDRHLKLYGDVLDLDSVSVVYPDYYYQVTNAFDSVYEDKISNVIQVILGDPDYDKISLRAYAGHEYRRFGMLSPNAEQTTNYLDTISYDPLEFGEKDTVVPRLRKENFNDIFVGFSLAGPTTGTWDWVLDGQYYLLGYFQNDFRINATFSRQFLKVARLGLRGSMELKHPHYFAQNYASSFYVWENDFAPMYRIKGEAFSQSDELEMDLRASIAYMRNYLYWDEQAFPRVFEDDILVFSSSLSKHFEFSGFNSEDKVLFQYTTAGDVMPLPLLAVYSSNYWKQPLFKGALLTTLGFDFYMTSRYRASAYMPATGIFHLQDDYYTGAFPFLDVFLAFRIARTRIFASYCNLLQGPGLLGNNYFTSYLYPMKPRHLRLGLVWTFYD